MTGTAMRIAALCRRELQTIFTSPLAYVFIVIFLGLTGGLAFFLGGFLDQGNASLDAFFRFHPWLYLLLIPAIGMRLWAEERKTGTIEVIGKPQTLKMTVTARVATSGRLVRM